jgi:glycerol kinase
MMHRQAGVNLQTINADGGATRNRFLMQFIADMTGLEVAAADIPDCSPLGAALAGSIGMGVYKSFDDLAALPREVATYRPQMAQPTADALHAGWNRAVQQVLAGA